MNDIVGRTSFFSIELSEILESDLDNCGKWLAILKLIDNTCHYCWDGDSKCQCWNDE